LRLKILVDLIAEVHTIDLKGYIPNGASIELLRAEVPVGRYYVPVALVRYSLQGVEQEFGLRLDMDKRAFIDHFEDEELEGIIQQAAPKIVELVGSILYPR
jgi:hypothetical protein